MGTIQARDGRRHSPLGLFREEKRQVACDEQMILSTIINIYNKHHLFHSVIISRVIRIASQLILDWLNAESINNSPSKSYIVILKLRGVFVGFENKNLRS